MRLPNERPHGIQIIKTCEALKKQGVDVELWVAARGKIRNRKLEEIFSFYGIKGGFNIKVLPVLDFLPSWWKSGFYLESLSFFVSAAFALRRVKEEVVVYTRDEIILFLAFLTKRKIFWEAHMLPRSRFLLRKRLKKIGGIVAISQSLKNLLQKNFNYWVEKIGVAHDAVDLEVFGAQLSKETVRQELNVPTNKKIAVYSGGLFQQKGIFVLLKVAALLDDSWLFLVVGGNRGDETEAVRKFIVSAGIKNALLVGHVPHRQVIRYLAAADVLVLPNSAQDERTRDFTSPLKLFEYMASDRPIVASATPTIKEVLNEGNAVLVAPDDVQALKGGLLKIFTDYSGANLLAANARRDVQNFTWEKRVQKICNFINQSD